MNIEELAARLEAILFSSGEPVTADKLCAALMLPRITLDDTAAYLAEKYSRTDSGIELLRLENAYQLAVKKDYSSDVRTALEIKRSSALSPAAMEVLAVAAYNQPVTKAFIEHVRGVDSSSVVNSLVEKDLLCESGRLNLPGRPIAYKTTDNFLRAFGLESTAALPPLPQAAEQLSMDTIEKENEENS